MLKGSIVALSTPFKDDGVNIDTLKKLIEFHNKNYTDGILVGTTGESPTISDKEREEIITTALSLSKSPVIVGTGTNSTEKTIKMTKNARELGAEYALVITPLLSPHITTNPIRKDCISISGGLQRQWT